jgi:hypothetical protein
MTHANFHVGGRFEEGMNSPQQAVIISVAFVSGVQETKHIHPTGASLGKAAGRSKDNKPGGVLEGAFQIFGRVSPVNRSFKLSRRHVHDHE